MHCKLCIPVTLSMAALVLPASTWAMAATKVALPAGTPVQIVTKNMISVGAIKTGDVVDFSVGRPIAVNGWIVVASGASAKGHVVSAGGYKATYNPLHPTASQPIEIQADYVVSADGGKIKLDPTPIEIKGQTRRVMFNQATSPAVAQAGAAFMVKTDHLVHVLATQRASAQGGYDQ